MILITGASGLLGSAFSLTAKKYFDNVIAVYNQHPTKFEGIINIQGDLRKYDVIKNIIYKYKPKLILHCAAITNVDWCEKNPHETKLVNTEMSRNIASIANKTGSKLVYISTDSVFDGSTGYYSEKDITAPVNVYAKTKLEGEKAVNQELDNNLIIRTNFFGWNIQKKKNLAEWILNRLESNLKVPGFSDIIFSPIFTNQLCEIIMELIQQQVTGLFHIGGSQACSKYEFALQIADIFGYDKQLIQPISITNTKLYAPRPRNTSLNTSKIKHTLNITLPNTQKGILAFKAERARIGKSELP